MFELSHCARYYDPAAFQPGGPRVMGARLAARDSTRRASSRCCLESLMRTWGRPQVHLSTVGSTFFLSPFSSLYIGIALQGKIPKPGFGQRPRFVEYLIVEARHRPKPPSWAEREREHGPCTGSPSAQVFNCTICRGGAMRSRDPSLPNEKALW